MLDSRKIGEAGVSYIEMVIVIVLFALLMTIVMPRSRRAIEHATVNRAATVLATDLLYAQVLAARYHRPMVVDVDGAAKIYTIKDRTTGAFFRTRAFGAGSDFSLDLMSAAPGSAQLFPNGVASQSVMFTVGLNGFQREVRLSRAGQIRIIPLP